MKKLKEPELENIVGLIKSMIEEREPDAKLPAIIENMRTSLNKMLGFIVVDDVDNPKSVAWCVTAPDLFKGYLVTTVVFAYTDPEHRRQGIGSSLIEFATLVAETKGSVKLLIGSDTEDTARLWKKKGGKKTTIIYEIEI